MPSFLRERKERGEERGKGGRGKERGGGGGGGEGEGGGGRKRKLSISTLSPTFQLFEISLSPTSLISSPLSSLLSPLFSLSYLLSLLILNLLKKHKRGKKTSNNCIVIRESEGGENGF